MEDFANILQRDYGIKPQGKSAPMARASAAFAASAKDSSSSGGLGSGSVGRSSPGLANRAAPFSPPANDRFGDDMFFGSGGASKIGGMNSLHHGFGSAKTSFDDVFGDSLSFGSSKQAPPPPAAAAPLYDDIFSGPLQGSSTTSAPRSNSFPVYDMPRYDDDIFGGVPGIRKSSASTGYEDVFGMGGVTSVNNEASADLLGGFGVAKPSRSRDPVDLVPPVVENSPLDELLPGFGPSEPAKKPSSGVGDGKPSRTSRDVPGFPVEEPTVRSAEMDPFGGLTTDSILSNNSYAAASTFVDPLDPFEMQLPRGQEKTDANLKSKAEGTNVDPYDAFDGFSQVKSSEAPQPSKAKRRDEETTPPVASATSRDLPEADFVYSRTTNDKAEKFPASPSGKEANDNFGTTASGLNTSKNRSVRFDEPAIKNEFSNMSESYIPDAVHGTTEDIWLTIDDVKLVTMPTTAPPPSRPAPRRDFDGKRSSATRRSEVKSEDNSSDYSETANDLVKDHNSYVASSRVPTNFASSIDDLEQFASGRFQSPPEANIDFLDGDEQVPSAKLKEASERVEAKLRLAKEGREKDREEKDREAKAAKLKEEKEEKERELRLRQEREAKEREAREELERQRIQREKEREREREREKDRAAVERATQEARERAADKAAAEARERSEKAAAEARQRAERAAVERVTAEARERAAAEARERAAAEARERAAAEAREREAKEKAAMERAAAEAKERAAAERAAVERATAEARARAERAAVERANAEARERAAERAAIERAAAEARERAERAAERAAVQRAAAEARERAEKAAAEKAAAAAAAAREQQQRRNENDLESFFGMSGSRAASAPKQRPATSDFFAPEQKVPSTDGQWRSPSTAPPVRKVSSTTNMTDDWTSLFATPVTAEFQEIDGEAPERRKARLERYQRTQERAAKALAEKNQRDLDAQREQAEKHRAADMLDAEIKRWAAGKEGNLRALLSTLQYVLWPECGWQPVSLTDLITAAAVKKVYRKATLYVHPDKVQQKGATVQQKYVAEKVFDLLKEAWNKFNSEELF